MWIPRNKRICYLTISSLLATSLDKSCFDVTAVKDIAAPLVLNFSIVCSVLFVHARYMIQDVLYCMVISSCDHPRVLLYVSVNGVHLFCHNKKQT